MVSTRQSLTSQRQQRHDRCKCRYLVVFVTAVVLIVYSATMWAFVSVRGESREMDNIILQVPQNELPRKPLNRQQQVEKPSVATKRTSSKLEKRQGARGSTSKQAPAESKDDEPLSQQSKPDPNTSKEEQRLTSRVKPERLPVRFMNRTNIIQRVANDVTLPIEINEPEANVLPVTDTGVQLNDAQNTSLPFKVTIAHKMRNDLMGSFVAPTVYLLAVARHYNYNLVILPFLGSIHEKYLKMLIGLGDKIDTSWGTGFQDASHRKDYDPVELNARIHETMGFFPPISNSSVRQYPWIKLTNIPTPQNMTRACGPNATKSGHCYIKLPDNPHYIQEYMMHNEGCDAYFPPEFRKYMRDSFLRDKPGPSFFAKDAYNIAMHVRRGDILDPARWIHQPVYAALARRICKEHANAMVHVFSSGPNRDGNWSVLEEVSDVCTNVSFHLNDHEIDAWVHMVSADALIMSKSSFSAIPALICQGDVYFPRDYWHIRLSSFRVFDTNTGDLVASQLKQHHGGQ
ncbi:hypothetical protein MPSEU_000434100 [Mayamaea pseudoterrestris]|nr:hypothetical protein MPSEU_000434100 [Mayamaea pseudoterrestris]